MGWEGGRQLVSYLSVCELGRGLKKPSPYFFSISLLLSGEWNGKGTEKDKEVSIQHAKPP